MWTPTCVLESAVTTEKTRFDKTHTHTRTPGRESALCHSVSPRVGKGDQTALEYRPHPWMRMTSAASSTRVVLMAVNCHDVTQSALIIVYRYIYAYTLRLANAGISALNLQQNRSDWNYTIVYTVTAKRFWAIYEKVQIWETRI